MESSVRKRLLIALASVLSVVAVAVGVSSCEHAFPDDRLDFYWRLDRIEYKDGVNLKGEACQSEDVDNTMIGFARHMVLIEDLSRNFVLHGIMTEHSDSIRLDYSVYDDPQVALSLLDYGMDSVVTSFKVEYPDRGRLILSTSKVTMRLRKW